MYGTVLRYKERQKKRTKGICFVDIYVVDAERGERGGVSQARNRKYIVLEYWHYIRQVLYCTKIYTIPSRILHDTHYCTIC